MKARLNAVPCALFVLGFQLCALAAPQTPSGQSEQKPDAKQEQKTDQKVVIGTSEVVLDVVVRDKKGRAVKDLAASDFDVTEDGVKQQIQSFRLYQRESGEAAAEHQEARQGGGATTSGPSPFAGVSVVALVFDRLSPEARELAHKAALSYVSGAFNQDDFAGVYLVDLSLRTLQPITNNKELLTKAIDRAASLSTSTFGSVAEQSSQITDQAQSLQDQNASMTSTGGSGGQGGGSAPSNPGAGAELIAARMNQNMLDAFETLQRDQQGYATDNALLAIIDSLKGIEGRKALVFFSEGLVLPPAVAQGFPAVISAANRAGVSVYSIDAGGLRVESPLASTVREQNTVATRRRISNQANEDTSGHPMSRDLERNEDVLRLNPDSGLTQLAEQTGGFLIKDTNNLKSGLTRIDEDMRFHYVISYVPKNADYDGRFRQIAVKLDRPGLEIQTRKGYFALPNVGGAPILDYEAPALAALANTKAGDDPAMHAAAFNFPRDKNPGLVPVMVQVPGRDFAYEVDKEKNIYKSDFAIVAVVRDQSEQIIAKLSQHYQVSGPADKVEQAKAAQILFYREAQLPPGHYAVETIAYDETTHKGSLRETTVDVPAADDSGLRLSSVAILDRAERLSDADKKVENPFHFGEVLVYPNMGQPLSKSINKQFAYFFCVYQAKGATSTPKLNITVTKDGKKLADGSPALGPADSAGRIQYASAIPLDKFQPGNYSLEVKVSDGHTTVSRMAQFTVKP